MIGDKVKWEYDPDQSRIWTVIRQIPINSLNIPKYCGKRNISYDGCKSIRIIAHGDKRPHAKTQQKKQDK